MVCHKILLITPWYGTFAGGAEKLTRSLAHGFSEYCCEPLVLTTCSGSPYGDWWLDYFNPGLDDVDRIPVIRYSCNKTGKLSKELSHDIFIKGNNESLVYRDFLLSSLNSDKLVEDISRFINDGYHPIAISYSNGLVYSALKKYAGLISFIPCFHNDYSFYQDTTSEMLKNAKHIFFNSIEESQLCHDVFPEITKTTESKSTITGIFVDLKVKERTMPASDDRYFVYVGRIDFKKNVVLMCDWFLKYKESTGSESKLVIIGSGEDGFIPKCDGIVRTGYVTDDAKSDLICNATALINLSTNESFSYSIMESWTLSRPVIVSAYCSVTKGHALRANGGFWVSNEEEFILTLRLLEQDRILCDEAGMNGRNYVETNFKQKDVIAKYAKTLL